MVAISRTQMTRLKAVGNGAWNPPRIEKVKAGHVALKFNALLGKLGIDATMADQAIEREFFRGRVTRSWEGEAAPLLKAAAAVDLLGELVEIMGVSDKVGNEERALGIASSVFSIISPADSRGNQEMHLRMHSLPGAKLQEVADFILSMTV